jgi:predicted DNA-binding transcriptional regulator YafY
MQESPEPDGSVVLHHDVADPRWVVRHVLQYGGEAELVEPGELRERVARAARVVAERAA